MPSDPSVYLTSGEAAARLGVKPETLYAYASRGLVRSVPGPAGRPRRYAAEDVERLRDRAAARAGHAAVAVDALRWGEPVLDSALTEITERGPCTRGALLVDCAARGVPFEDVAQHVWGERPLGADGPRWSVAPARAPLGRHARTALARVAPLAASGTTRLGRLALVVTAMGALDDTRVVTTPQAEHARMRAVLPAMIAALALPELARARRVLEGLEGGAPLATALLDALDARAPRDAKARAAIDAVLAVSADHELNASTFSARVTASAGADLYACLSGALATMSGPKHGGMAQRLEALADALHEGGRARETLTARARSLIEARLGQGEGIPGFGHPLYPAGDPRAAPLLDRARALTHRSRNAGAGRVLALVDAMRALRGEPPTIDAGSVAVALSLGLPTGSAGALFAIGRAAGWVAHVLEQREHGALLRPRARFVGRPYVAR